MQLTWRRFDLELTHRWTIARTRAPGADGAPGAAVETVVLVRLESSDGLVGRGEAAPCPHYAETPETVERFLRRLDPDRLRFDALPDALAYLAEQGPGDAAARGALDVALHDAAARRAGRATHDFLGLPFTEGRHVTSFSIGLDTPEVVRAKVRAAAAYPVLKIKLGGPDDRAVLRAVRDAAPDKPLRVDANEGWSDPETALRRLEWLAEAGGVQFVEQPLPARASAKAHAWLKARSPLPLMADESYRTADDLPAAAAGFHAVNVKLVKTGGLAGAKRALEAARKAGLKTMLGCMIESSLLITAAAHLADLTDYLDLDGHLLIRNDPFQGVAVTEGVLSLAAAPERLGLQVAARGSGPV
jgi:L-alanine-DL-glutamate epimerase-like enolase superfamily enzyme